MSEPGRCTSCGRPLDPPGPGGLCPICLLSVALQEDVGSETMGGEAGTSRDAEPMAGRALAAAVPNDIGPYHLLQVLGEGGMGLVYLAEQREPIARRVALKLIKPGMDTREVLARFEAERQALALMDHPNIARVLDAGLGPGDRPYFVMEYVAGIPITDYCDRHRLRNAERLQIFLHVCAALQHAHQKGIIHRDLKPSNILVTVQDGRPVPKVIDFGIAKATRQGSLERAAFTQLGMLIGTPEYISPEQAEASGLEVDTTTDIYSLGVVLYELLTGVLPFDSEALRRAGYAEMHRIIREQDPPKPSLRVTALGATAADIARQHQTTTPGLGKQLRGDLDAIAMKAMEKDRTRRYASASEFAADITRYLNGEPVVARPPSVRYRAGKFVRRYRAAVLGGIMVALVLVAGLTATSLMYARSEAARQAEQRQRASADRRAYLANVLAADLSLRAGNTRGARLRLDAAGAAFRGWEWDHLSRLADSSLAIAPVDGQVMQLVASPGGSGVTALILKDTPPETGKPWGVTMLEATVTFGSDGRNLATSAMPGSSIALSPDGLLAAVAPWNAYRDRGWYLFDFNSPVEERGELRILNRRTQRVLTALHVPDAGEVPATVPGAKAMQWIPDEGGPGLGYPITGGSTLAMSATYPFVVAAAFSRDASMVAAWSWRNVITVWDSQTGRTLATLAGHRDRVTAVMFSRDSRRVYSASRDRSVRVWDLRTGTAMGSITCAAPVVAAALSPDDRLITLTTTGPSVETWTADMLVRRWARPIDVPAAAVAFSPDGRIVSIGSNDGSIRSFEAGSGQMTSVLRGHVNPVVALVYAADDRLVSAATHRMITSVADARHVSAAATRSLRLWNPGEAGLRLVGRHDDAVTEVAFGPSGATLYSSGCDGTIREWRLAKPEVPRVFRGHVPTKVDTGWLKLPDVNVVVSLAVNADGSLLASAGMDNTVRLWSAASGDQVAVLDGGGGGMVAFSPDGLRVAAVGGAGAVRIWNASTGAVLHDLASEGSSDFLQFTTDGRSLVARGERSIRVWDAATFTLRQTIQVGEGPFGGQSPYVPPTALSRDGRRVAVGMGDGNVQIRQLDGGQLVKLLKGSGDSILAVAYSPDDTRLAVAAADGTVHLWDASTWEDVLGLDLDKAWAVESAPGRPAAPMLGRRLLKLALGVPGEVPVAVAFSPDGRRLASGWSDGAVVVWNAGPKGPR